jgi:ankyrin repeat protein
MASEDERHELFVALLGAVDADDLEVQRNILIEHPELLKMSDLEGRTALHRAAGRGLALSLTHLISMSPDLGIANVSICFHVTLALKDSYQLAFRSVLTVIARLCTSAQASAAHRASKRCSNLARM